jgi:hypothetical protein
MYCIVFTPDRLRVFHDVAAVGLSLWNIEKVP